jgi:hypothetical protein
MIFQLYVDEYCTAELRIKWWKNERGGGSCSVHRDDFSILCRRILYSGAKDQMVEEREGRRVLFGMHKDDFSIICRRILYSRAKDQMVEE